MDGGAGRDDGGVRHDHGGVVVERVRPGVPVRGGRDVREGVSRLERGQLRDHRRRDGERHGGVGRRDAPAALHPRRDPHVDVVERRRERGDGGEQPRSRALHVAAGRRRAGGDERERRLGAVPEVALKDVSFACAGAQVGLVVDRAFGERVVELARRFHVWIVASPANMPTVRLHDELDVGISADRRRALFIFVLLSS